MRIDGVRFTTVLILALLVVMGDMTAAAQDAPPTDLVPEASETAMVTLDGVNLFRIRGTSSFPAPRRAAEIARRITEAAADPTVSPDSLRIQPDDLGLAVVVNGRRLYLLVEADAHSEDLTLPLLAAACMMRTSEAIENYRRDREPGRNLRNALVVGGLGLVLALGLALFIRGTRRAEAHFAGRYRSQVEIMESRTFQLINAERLWWALRATTAGLRTLTLVLVIYGYLQWSLNLFPWTRQFGQSLFKLVSDPVRTILHEMVNYLPELFFLVILFILFRLTLQGLRTFFGAVESGRIVLRDFDTEWAQPTHRIVRFMTLALFVVVAYPYIPGSSSGAFKGVSLLLGLLVSLGSSSVIANLISGYTMIYRRAFRVGDRIRVGSHLGDVMTMRPFGVSLRTPKNEEIILPNSEIMNNAITNYSALAREQGLILHTTAGIGYETPWRQVEAMLLMAAGRTSGLVPGSQSFVLQTELGDFAVTYELNVFCDSAQRMTTVYSELHGHIQDVFNEYGVAIMTPAYESDPEVPKVVPKEHWYDAPAVPPVNAKE